MISFWNQAWPSGHNLFYFKNYFYQQILHQFKRIINHYYTGRHFKHFVKSFLSYKASKKDALPCYCFAGVDSVINTLLFAMQMLQMSSFKNLRTIKHLCFDREEVHYRYHITVNAWSFRWLESPKWHERAQRKSAVCLNPINIILKTASPPSYKSLVLFSKGEKMSVRKRQFC